MDDEIKAIEHAYLSELGRLYEVLQRNIVIGDMNAEKKFTAGRNVAQRAREAAIAVIRKGN
jgi:hypothetical protein